MIYSGIFCQIDSLRTGSETENKIWNELSGGVMLSESSSFFEV